MSTFTQKAPKVIYDLIHALPLSVLDGAAIAGNGGHESEGFTDITEDKPTIKGSRGGLGWFQWTGKRRRAFEAWCKAKGYKYHEDRANIGFLIHELRTTEAKAIGAVKRAATLEGKVKAFELAFERAGVKHYASRTTYARRALDAWNASPLGKGNPATPAGRVPAVLAEEVQDDLPGIPPPPDVEGPVVDDAVMLGTEVEEPKSLAKSTTIWAAISMAVSSGAGTVLYYITSWQAVVLIIGLVAIGAAFWIIRERIKHRKESGI